MQTSVTDPPCPICGASTHRVLDSMIGYRSDLVFAIVECAVCGLSRALPAVADEMLYQWIYENTAKIPGYARYDSYFNRVKTERDPLRYLEQQEEAYWACAAYLKAARPRFREEPRILEVGCGTGYFTHALRCAGYRVTGYDISSSAIAKASGAFGPDYKQVDIESVAPADAEQFDIVIMIELLEHVANPLHFLRTLGRFVSANGEIFLTTPNKDTTFGLVRSAWETELPPVHLYWFTERSIESLGKLLGCEVSFCDFSKYFEERFIAKARQLALQRTPTFAPDGTILVEGRFDTVNESRAISWSRRVADSIGVLSVYRHIRGALERRERWSGRNSATLAAWLKLGANDNTFRDNA